MRHLLSFICLSPPFVLVAAPYTFFSLYRNILQRFCLLLSLCASQEVRRGLALWGTPGFAFLSFGRGFARFGTAFVAGFLDSFGRFFGSWYQCLEAFSRNSDAYSVMPDIQGQGGITDQPGSIAEGLV